MSVSWAAAAGAEPAVAVAIVDAGSDELARKLGAEVRYAGFVVVAPNGEVSDAAGATPAAVRLRVNSPERVTLEFTKPNDGASAETHELAMLLGEGDAFALRTVEFARARLVDLGWQVPEERTEVVPVSDASPPSAAAAIEPPARNPSGPASPVAPAAVARELWVGVGPAASTAVGGFALSPQAALTLQAELTDHLAVNLRGAVPITPASAARREGTAQLSWYAALAGVQARFALDADWFAHVGVEAGVSRLSLRGEATPGYAGRDERVYAGTAAVSFEVGRRLNDWLRLRGVAAPGVIAPRPVVRFDAREVATIGTFYGSFGLSLEAGFDWRSEEP